MPKRKKFSSEFKREAGGLGRQPGAQLGQVARDIGVGAGIQGRCRPELEAERTMAFSGSGVPRYQDMPTLRRAPARIKKERGFFARCGCVLRQGTELKYQTTRRCRGLYPAQLMCRCLKVSSSSLGTYFSP